MAVVGGTWPCGRGWYCVFNIIIMYVNVTLCNCPSVCLSVCLSHVEMTSEAVDDPTPLIADFIFSYFTLIFVSTLTYTLYLCIYTLFRNIFLYL